MRILLCVGAVASFIVYVAGCAESRKVVTHLPDPVFETTPPAPASRPPVFTPAPKAQARPPLAKAGWFPPGGVLSRWECIVLHHSASENGGAEAFDGFHRHNRGWEELGYHFVIGNGTDTGDGQVEVGSRWTKQKHGAHCKTPDNYYNDHGIGICLVGDFRHRRPTPAQMASLTQLVDFLLEECGIDESRILTHGGVTHRTECPGAHFSLAALKTQLGSGVAAVSHVP